MNFVPAFALSYGKLVFEKLTGVEDIKFRRFLLSAGYGLRNMLSSYYGLFYFDIVPTLNYTRLGWEGKDVRGDGDAIKMNFISEIGYKYYFFRRWSLRFFVKSVTENRELWQRALDESATKTIVLRGARSTYAGFSLEYFFDDYK